MKMNKKNTISVSIIIFSFFLLFYIILSLFLTYRYRIAYTYDLPFGSDTNRVLEDLINFSANHYRTDVHPLFVLFIHPIVYIMNYLFINNTVTVLALQSILGAANVVIVLSILRRIKVNNIISILLSLIYGFSFSSIIFTIIPETFIFSSFFLLLFWAYIFKIMDKPKLKIKDYVILTLFGVISISMTLTNVFQFLIGFFFLLIKMHSKDKAGVCATIKKFLLITAVVIFLSWILACLQKFIFPTSVNFLNNIIFGGSNQNAYINFDITVNSFLNVSKVFFFNSFISTDVILSNNVMSFTSFGLLDKIIFVISFILPLVMIVISFKKKSENDLFIKLMLIFSILFNYLLHLIYGVGETFLYTQHFVFLLIILIGFSSKILIEKNKINGMIVTLLLFLGYELLCNASAMFDVLKIVQGLFPPMPDDIILLFTTVCSKVLFIAFIVFLLYKTGSFHKYLFIFVVFIVGLVVLMNLSWFINKIRSNIKLSSAELKEEIKKFDLYEEKLTVYKNELLNIRNNYEVKDYSFVDNEFMFFGMGKRRKLWYHDGILSDLFTNEIIFSSKVEKEVIVPNEYLVVINNGINYNVRIYEDEMGVWVEDPNNINNKVLVAGTDIKIELFDFNDYNYKNIMKVLYQELLFNIRDGIPTPNIIVYPDPWYRDGMMMAMVLKQTNNIDLIADWIKGIDKIYDLQNSGIEETDNLGQLLYLISFVSDSKHPLVDKIIEEARNKSNGKYLTGKTDFAEQNTYQTLCFKLGMSKLGLKDNYIVPNVGTYSSLAWWSSDNINKPFFGVGNIWYPYISWANNHTSGYGVVYMSTSLYPLTWEEQASNADYSKLIFMNEYVKESVSPTHGWHAAEMLLLLMDRDIKLEI